MSNALVLTEKQGNIYKITLNRPDKRNALTMDMMQQIAAAFREVDKHPEVRAVIVDGNGPIFSAGIDVMGLAMAKAEAGDQNPARWLRTLARELQEWTTLIEEVEVPVIGALHGKCYGLGLELALCFDFRVVSPDIEISLPETKLGLIADVGGTTRLTKLIGPSRAKDMLMTARTVGAEEALQWGLVNRIATEGTVQEAATALANDIAKNAPLAVGLAKLVVNQGDGLDKHTQLAMERMAQSLLVTSEDMMEAMSAFMEKRPPVFKGR